LAVGLIALLDDVAAIAKVAAASLDDIAGQAAKAGAKAAGVVIDDAAVTPRYVVGFAAERELPIVWRIAIGSLKNKLLFLLPAALALSFFAPWLITPLLMLGGAYLCYEGAEKVYEALFPHAAHAHEATVAEPADATAMENQKVAGAIKTDFILSAEIMAITLAAVPEGGFWTQATVLAVVGLGITIGVYGVVALIVKADDAGVALAANRSQSTFGSIVRGVGRGLVVGMPILLKLLAIIGTAAMVWVGGGIIVHGLEVYGLPALGHFIHDAAAAAGHAVPFATAAVEWLVSAAGAGVVGLAIGAAVIPLTSYVLAPAAKGAKKLVAQSA
jgi:predicted DNA repair protein MutK